MGKKEENYYIYYEHHGNAVWVRSDHMGLHNEHCLCHDCGKFKPDTDKHCRIAGENFAFCIRNKTVAPIWECPDFEEKI